MSTPLNALLSTFETDLHDVRFGDVDAASLAALAAEVDAADAAVARAQSALDDARAALVAKNDALLQHAHRALAYARVYAESDPALAARLATITLPKLARKARPEETTPVATEGELPKRPRGRPRKAPLATALPGIEASAE